MITALSWSVSLLLATLFRIEAAIFLLTLPFVSWLHFSQLFRQRLKSFFTLNLLTLLILVILGIGLLFYPQSNMKLGRLLEISNQFQHGINLLIERYHTARMALLQHVLTPDAVNDAGLVLIFVWLAWYLVNLIQTLSGIYSALVVYAWYKKVISLSSQACLVVGAYLSVNVLITLSFLVERSFLSKRYMIALALICMLWVPFALNSLIQRSSNLRYRIILAIVVIFIFISFIGGIIDFGYSKTYIRSAGDWIAKNVPAQAFLYANDYQLMYYSQHFGYALFEKASSYVEVDTIIDDKWKKYDYLALRLNAKADDGFSLFLKKLPLLPLETFSNRRGDKVVIYRVFLNNAVQKN
jgi:hypothetical protein